jgi:hypothetical protein
MRTFNVALAAFIFPASVIVADTPDCRCMPSDSCWPAATEWKALNTTVHGRLVATTPLGSPCHDPIYKGTECAILQSEWHDPQLQ